MAVAGSLTYETKLDTSGFQKGMNDIERLMKAIPVGRRNAIQNWTCHTEEENE